MLQELNDAQNIVITTTIILFDDGQPIQEIVDRFRARGYIELDVLALDHAARCVCEYTSFINTTAYLFIIEDYLAGRAPTAWYLSDTCSRQRCPGDPHARQCLIAQGLYTIQSGWTCQSNACRFVFDGLGYSNIRDCVTMYCKQKSKIVQNHGSLH